MPSQNYEIRIVVYRALDGQLFLRRFKWIGAVRPRLHSFRFILPRHRP